LRPLILIIVAIWLTGLLLGLEIYKRTEKENYFIYKDRVVENSTRYELFLMKNTTLKPGEYKISFEYSAAEPVILQVVSVAEYDLESDSFRVYREKEIPAADNKKTEHGFSLEKEQMMVSVLLYSENAKIPGVTNLVIENTSECYSDARIYAVLAALSVYVAAAYAFCIVCGDRTGNKKQKIAVFIVLVTVCLLASSIYLTKATPSGHDIAFHMRRIEGLAKNIYDGNFLRRINTVFNAGYGYLNPVMYPEMFLYLPAFLVFLGMSTLGAMRIFYIAVNICTVFCSFYAFRGISRDDVAGALLSAIYTLSFYRMENVYIRGAMGESLFMAFLPLAVYALYTIMYEDRKRWLLFALSVSAIIQSHILGTLFTVIILGCEFIVFALDLIIRKKFRAVVVLECVKSVIFTVLINFWFIIPFMYYYFTQKFMMFDKSVQMERFFQQLIPLESMFSLTLIKTNIVENMGILVMLALIGACYGCIDVWVRNKERRYIIPLFCTVFILGLACTDVFPWKVLSEISVVSAFMNTIQFSFRFYGVFICGICMVIALAYNGWLGSKGKYIALAAVIAVGCFSTYDFYRHSGVNKKNARYEAYYYDAPNEYLMPDAVLANEIGNPKKVHSTDNILIKDYSKDGDKITICIEKTGTEQGLVKLPLFYYYGYGAQTQTGERINLVSGENGCLTCVVNSPGVNIINVQFRNDRKIFIYPLAVSFLFVIGFIVFICYDKFRKMKKFEEQ